MNRIADTLREGCYALDPWVFFQRYFIKSKERTYNILNFPQKQIYEMSEDLWAQLIFNVLFYASLQNWNCICNLILQYQIGLWLVLSFFYSDVLSDFSDQLTDLGTTTHDIPTWPVISDTGEVFVCSGNLTFTPPNGSPSAIVSCSDHSCSRNLNRQTVK